MVVAAHTCMDLFIDIISMFTKQVTQHCFRREVHIPHGTPYEPDENTVIAEMQLSQTNVSGYYTDMMVMLLSGMLL